MEDIEIGYILFADGYDADGNPTHKQEFITYKSKCEELIKTNQALKDRWQKLKEFVIDELRVDRQNFKSTESSMYDYFCVADQTILDKMQELEQGEKDGTINNQKSKNANI